MCDKIFWQKTLNCVLLAYFTSILNTFKVYYKNKRKKKHYENFPTQTFCTKQLAFFIYQKSGGF